MNISYNNQDSPTNMLTFTEIPNILKIQEYVTGSQAIITLLFEGDLRPSVTADSQYYITILGETISNVMDARKANNKRFFISSDADATSMSVCRALRNCGGLVADFNIIHGGAQVRIVAKTIGNKGLSAPNAIQRNIPSSNLSISISEGGSDSNLFNSKIDVDIYSASTSNNINDYVTTLEKNWYENECAFDMSPVLSTISEYGKTVPYCLVMSMIEENGEWTPIVQISASTTIGFHANQSMKYMTAEGVQMLLNKSRGEDGIMTLYTYSPTIPYSVLCSLNTGGWDITVSVLDSAFNEIYNSGRITQRRTSSNMIVDTEFIVPESVFYSAYYIDIYLGAVTEENKTRFNVIKPLKATEYYQRIFWRNEYGGISFFDFTGSKSESDSVDIETYEKNIFDYYETEEFERKRIYSNDYNKTVTLSSHLMEEDGKWIFNSLMRSKKVWTTVNGNVYYIIPKSIDVQEDQSYNNIFTAKLTYEYSDI